MVIPPQRNATLSQNSNTAMQERDRHIRAIERHGRREWYKLSGYTKRSMVENAVYRYKAIIGPEMRARTLARQRVEHRIGCEILNGVLAVGQDGRARDARYVLRRVTLQPASGRSAIRRLGLVTHSVRQGCLAYGAWKIGPFLRPIPKTRTEPMGSDVMKPHSSQHHQEDHVRERFCGAAGWKHIFSTGREGRGSVQDLQAPG